MSKKESYVDYLIRVNGYTEMDIDRLIDCDECPYEPERTELTPAAGMFHCPICGDMVVAGMPHPKRYGHWGDIDEE